MKYMHCHVGNLMAEYFLKELRFRVLQKRRKADRALGRKAPPQRRAQTPTEGNLNLTPKMG